jgi:multiple sugar transport system permease protein
VTGEALYAIGTLATWVGWGFAFFTLVQLMRLGTRAPGLDRTRTIGSITASAITAAAFLFVAFVTSRGTADETAATEGASVPLVWIVMPFWGWAALVCSVVALARVLQTFLALNREQVKASLGAGAVWIVAAAVFFLVYRYVGGTVELLRGAIRMQTTVAIILALLAIGATAAMILAGRASRTRGYSKAVVTHVALIVGSIIFGLPFAWLVITSFKEDRDMASPHGLVWIPKVQEKRPYFDPSDPRFETRFEGKKVEATLIERLPDGQLKLDVFKPMAMRGITFTARESEVKEVPKQVEVVTAVHEGRPIEGMVVEEMEDGRRRVSLLEPAEMQGQILVFAPAEVEPVRHVGLRWQNYPEALEFLPPETNRGLVYLKNTLIIVILSVIGTILSSSVVAYAFSRMRFPGKGPLFVLLLSTMMLPAAVTLLPQFLIFRSLGWIDTLYPLWVPAFFASAFNVFLLRQFFMTIPMEFEEAARIDGASYIKTFWSVMLPQIKPALAVVAIWTFMGAWNNFMGPLIYINSPENMPIAYALQLFRGDRINEPGLLMAFTTLAIIPVVALFFFAQRYFIEGVQLSGLGGR